MARQLVTLSKLIESYCIVMDEIKSYDLDSLSYIDQEYDNPIVKEYVDSLIRAEMSVFLKSSKNYLAHLPYPTLKFSNSPALQAEMLRVKSKQPMEKLDMSRYNVEPPLPSQEKDVQAWRSSVSNAQAQFEHQHNRLLNLDLTEKYGSDVWLRHNQTLEQCEALLMRECTQVGGLIHQVNHQRKASQEQARGELCRLIRRRDEAVMKSWQIETHCLQMEDTLHQHNISIPSSEEEEEEEEEEGEIDEDEQDTGYEDSTDGTYNKRPRVE